MHWLNLFLGSHPCWAAMLVSCGYPCVYIKIVGKISLLFVPWVCKLSLLSVSCRQSIKVCWRLRLHLSGSWFHTMALLLAAQLPGTAIPAHSPEQMVSPVLLISWHKPRPKWHKWTTCFVIWARIVYLPHPHSEWLLNLCWSCVETGSMFVLHCLVAGLEKKDAWLLEKHQENKYEPNNKAK